MVGTGPYTPDTYIPGKTIVLDRNPNWDPATDPLRTAWVDRIQIKLDVPIPSIQQAIEREEADLSLGSHVPQTRVAALRADPERSRRLSVNTTGSLLFLVLGTHQKAGAIADVRVRQAVNYAIDKAAYRDALAGRYAATGELASTILAPDSLGYRPYDLYPTPGGRGDPVKARALLAEAGYPNGLTLGFATLQRQAGGRQKADRGVPGEGRDRPEGHHQQRVAPHFEALGNPAKRLEHQLAQGGWLLDYPGDNARQTIVPQYDSRLDPVSGDFSEYHNPAVNRMIDRALAELDRDRRAAMWGEIDQRIMRDAPMVPLVWENSSFQWASRVDGWRYDPWAPGPTSPPCGWIPRAPDRGLRPGAGPARTAGGDQPCVAAHSAGLSGVKGDGRGADQHPVLDRLAAGRAAAGGRRAREPVAAPGAGWFAGRHAELSGLGVGPERDRGGRPRQYLCQRRHRLPSRRGRGTRVHRAGHARWRGSAGRRGLAFPNGMAVTPDNSTLIVSESFAGTLTAFDIGPDGSLSNRRVWAPVPADGIVLDAEGAVWTPSWTETGPACLRVAEGGAVLDAVPLDRAGFACTLGGEDGRTLFMLAADWHPQEGFEDNLERLTTGPPTGQVLTARAPAPHAGRP